MGYTLHLNNSWVTTESPAKELLYDLILPDNPAPPFPVLIANSVWVSGSKSFDPDVWRLYDFANAGIAVVISEFRGAVQLSPVDPVGSGAPNPTPCADLRGFIRYLRANAGASSPPLNQLDFNDITIMGGSAGGQLALSVGHTNASKSHEGNTGGNLDQSSKVQRVLAIYPSTDFTLYKPLPISDASEYNDQGARNIRLYLGGFDDWQEYESDSQKLDRVREISAVNFLDKYRPKTMIVHGTADTTNPYSQAEQYDRAMAELGLDNFTLVPVEGAGHTISEIMASAFDTMVDFIKDVV